MWITYHWPQQKGELMIFATAGTVERSAGTFKHNRVQPYQHSGYRHILLRHGVSTSHVTQKIMLKPGD